MPVTLSHVLDALHAHETAVRNVVIGIIPLRIQETENKPKIKPE